MLRFLGENLGLKIIAIATSILIWFYVGAERNPLVTVRRNAQPELTGIAPPNTIVRLRPGAIPVEITGPRTEVESISDGDVKALADQTTATRSNQHLRIAAFKRPAAAANVSFHALVGTVEADVIPKQRKRMEIKYSFVDAPPFGKMYGKVNLNPLYGEAVGALEDLKRVDRLIVFIDTRGGSVREDLTIQPQDKDDIKVDGVDVEPQTTHVTLDLIDAPASRVLPVSVSLTGALPAPYQVSGISVEPDQITVSGKSEVLQQMKNVSVAPVSVEGLNTDLTAYVPLRLPDGVTAQGGATRVKVTVRIRDVTKPAQ